MTMISLLRLQRNGRTMIWWMYKPPTKDMAYVFSNTLLVKLGIVALKDINRANILCWYRHVRH